MEQQRPAALRAFPGSAFEAVDVSSLKVSTTSYAVNGGPASRLPPAPPASPPPQAEELLADTGFRGEPASWRTGDRRTTLARTCSVAHSGTALPQLGRTSNGDALLDDHRTPSPGRPPDRRKTRSAWVRAPASRTVTLRFTQRSGSGRSYERPRDPPGTGASASTLLPHAPERPEGRRWSLKVVVSLVKGTTAQVDELSMKKA